MNIITHNWNMGTNLAKLWLATFAHALRQCWRFRGLERSSSSVNERRAVIPLCRWGPCPWCETVSNARLRSPRTDSRKASFHVWCAQRPPICRLCIGVVMETVWRHYVLCSVSAIALPSANVGLYSGMVIDYTCHEYIAGSGQCLFQASLGGFSHRKIFLLNPYPGKWGVKWPPSPLLPLYLRNCKIGLYSHALVRIKFFHISTGSMDMMAWNRKYILGNWRQCALSLQIYRYTSCLKL